jgi:hypothetical protein
MVERSVALLAVIELPFDARHFSSRFSSGVSLHSTSSKENRNFQIVFHSDLREPSHCDHLVWNPR